MLLGTAYAYLWLRHEEGLGMGDVKMLAMIGAFLGWKMVLLTLMVASFSGTVVGLGLIAARRGSMASRCRSARSSRSAPRSPRPSGPQLLDWYLKLW